MKSEDVMIKNIMFIFTLSYISISFSGCAGFVKKADPALRTYEKIVDLPNQTKNDLYIKANSWFVHTFTSAESVIEFQDKEAGKIMGNYTFDFGVGLDIYTIRQTISLDIKDNKIRVIISNPFYKLGRNTLTGLSGSYIPLESEAGISRCYPEWYKLIDSLEVSMKKDTSW